MQNIALARIKQKQYADAIPTYEKIFKDEPDIRTALNLILCYFKINDAQGMKSTFLRLLKTDLHLEDEDKYLPQPVSSILFCYLQ